MNLSAVWIMIFVIKTFKYQLTALQNITYMNVIITTLSFNKSGTPDFFG